MQTQFRSVDLLHYFDCSLISISLSHCSCHSRPVPCFKFAHWASCCSLPLYRFASCSLFFRSMHFGKRVYFWTKYVEMWAQYGGYYICIYIYICISMYICVGLYESIYIYTHVYTHIHTYSTKKHRQKSFFLLTPSVLLEYSPRTQVLLADTVLYILWPCVCRSQLWHCRYGESSRVRGISVHRGLGWAFQGWFWIRTVTSNQWNMCRNG